MIKKDINTRLFFINKTEPIQTTLLIKKVNPKKLMRNQK